MKILCYGAGAVGSFLGGHLSAAGHDVTLVVRPTAVAPLRRHGLALEDTHGQVVHARPRIVTGAADLRHDRTPPDLVLLTLKAYDVEAAIPGVTAVCGPETWVVSLQNGLGTEERLAEALGAQRVLAGAFTLSVSAATPGQVVQHTTAGGVSLAELVPLAKRPASLAAVFTSAGLRVRFFPNWRALKWSKLLLNLLANASCAIVDLTPAELFRHPGLFRLEQRAFGEARRVMRRLRLRPVDLPGYPVRLLCAAMALPAPLAGPLIAGRVGGCRGDKRPSLALDLARGKPQSEVSFLNGAVARIAAEHGLCAPTNARLADTLQAILAGTTDREAFARQPEALLSAVVTTRSQGS